MTEDLSDEHIRVLQTVPPATSTTNPFASLLVDHLPARVTSSYWSWKQALVGKYDVVHFQWPETLVSGTAHFRVYAKRLAFLLILLRLRHRRTGVVETIHNLKPHEARTRLEGLLLRMQRRLVHVRILLNDSEPAPGSAGTATLVIPHGDYSPLYSPPMAPAGNVNSILYFGLIRSYKQVPLLVREFLGIQNDRLQLNVLGKPWDESLKHEVESAAGKSPHVRLALMDIEEQDLVDEIRKAGLVVLPYSGLYNSGALLLALTLKTPVLVPSTIVTAQLKDEVGDGWVLTYEGTLNSEILSDAIARVAEFNPGRPGPELSGRDWSAIGTMYADAYSLAITRARGWAA